MNVKIFAWRKELKSGSRIVPIVLEPFKNVEIMTKAYMPVSNNDFCETLYSVLRIRVKYLSILMWLRHRLQLSRKAIVEEGIYRFKGVKKYITTPLDHIDEKHIKGIEGLTQQPYPVKDEHREIWDKFVEDIEAGLDPVILAHMLELEDKRRRKAKLTSRRRR